MQPLLTSDPNHVGDYQMLGRLGSGAMGSVFLGRSRGGRIVAVKVIRADLAEDPEFRERFRREVAMARSVGGLWTAAVVDADTEAEQPWLATEYVPGPTLHQAVAEHGPLPEQAVRTLGAGLAEALSAIHRAGLVHRDLKPANVLLGPDGPRVIDFGIARATTSTSLTATGMFLGTPGYFSPEQTLGDEVGPPSDVFSLGAVLAFAATGSGPFGEESTANLLYRVAHTEPDLSQVPAGLQPLIAACLAKDPSVRPTPEQILDQLGEVGPQSDQWLPPAITKAIDEAATELQRTAAMAEPVPAPEPVPAAPPPPATRSYTQAQPAPAAPLREEIVPARPKPTSRGTAFNPNEPGPVFRTGGRAAALFSAIVCSLFIFAAYVVSERFGLSSRLEAIYQIGVLLLTISVLWSIGKALLPPLRLKVSSSGLQIRRLGLNRQIPWNQIQRASIVGRGKKQHLAIWLAEGAPQPRSRIWHRVGSYHGGFKIYPVGAAGGWWARRQQGKQVREAFVQYAPGRYDDRLL
ncbi:serine/threonine protein kinase [Saccharopolyspora rectivirgula]|uniref:Serine/threonine protein kinase n=1 Tax=Saccharopolyspora rectivirgula TaxID=28042 RepID=A0A073BDP5_9PSEU|nr:serine/threonine protein kinase [Saccharopolyspora rectivirgula]